MYAVTHTRGMLRDPSTVCVVETLPGKYDPSVYLCVRGFRVMTHTIHPFGAWIDTHARILDLIARESLPRRTTIAFWVRPTEHFATTQLALACGAESARGWKITDAVMTPHTWYLKLQRGKRTIFIVDAERWLRASVEEIAAREHVISGSGAYAVAIALAQIVRWVRAESRAWMRPSMMGTMMGVFRRFLPPRTYIWSSRDAAALELEDAAYRGGIATACVRGKIVGPIFEIDGNAMYTRLAAEMPLPRKLYAVIERPTCAQLLDWITSGGCVIASVHVESPDVPYPCTRDFTTPAAVGSFDTVLATPELHRALTHDHVTHIHRAALYHGAYLALAFWEHVRRARASEYRSLAHWVKLAATTVWGFFGSRRGPWKLIGTDTTPVGACAWTEREADGKLAQYRKVGALVFRREASTPGNAPSLALAAHITSAARKLMTDIACNYVPNEWHTIYIDSITTTERGAHKLYGLGLLGSDSSKPLRVVAVHDWMCVWDGKTRLFPDGARICGVPAGSRIDWADEHRVLVRVPLSRFGAVYEGWYPFGMHCEQQGDEAVIYLDAPPYPPSPCMPWVPIDPIPVSEYDELHNAESS